ncbi:MAG: YfhO family protein [Bacteroidales bacterium]
MRIQFDYRKIIPHALAVILFLLIAFAYFPDVLEGKQLAGHDNDNFRGMARELIDYREATGKEALWTNNMFSGMPGYLISTVYKGNQLKYLDRLLQAGPRPVSFVFLYLLGFYLLLLAFRVNPWLAMAGAIAFAFSSYNFVILAAGHNSKAIAIAYMAPIIAGVFITFRGMRLLGAILTGVALSLQLMAGHPQITYYTLLIILLFGISELYYSIREKQLKDLMLSVGILVVAVGFSVTSNTARLWTTMQYGRYSMRAPSELTLDEADKTRGLTRSYATGWSYGIDETMSLLIPGFKGGSSDGPLSEKSETYRLFARSNPAQASEVIKHLPLYWGEQTSTMGNVYVGAVVIFLFVLGMFIGDPRIKWWLFAATVLGIMLAWGKNFMGLTNFFMDHMPGYSKFRTVSMTLVIPAFAMPLLAILTVNQLFFGTYDKQKLFKALKWAAGLTGGIVLVFFLLPDLAGDFVSARDSSYQQPLADALQADRRSLLRMDALRSLIFIGLTTGLIILFVRKTINVKMAVAALAVLFLVDMWPVDKRYLNKEHFTNKRQASQPFAPSPADQFILNQPGENQRVLNLTVSIFQDASTSYFHSSIGGYHGAKMRRYQDLIETGLMADINTLFGALQTQSYPTVDSALATASILNMLNTRYILINPDAQPIINNHAAGNAWFVSEVREVENADTDVAALAGMNILREATLESRFAQQLQKRSYPVDPASTIELVDYAPNRMVYISEAGAEQLAIFSEIYYEKGWYATVDGEPTDHMRIDYALRGMVVPEGRHEIIFEFHPRAYYTGSTISTISSILLLLMLLGSIGMQFIKGNGETGSTTASTEENS